MGWLLSPVAGHEKTRLAGGCGVDRIVMVGSVGAAALEGLEHHIAHCTDVGFDPLQPVGIGLAVVGAHPINPFALEV